MMTLVIFEGGIPEGAVEGWLSDIRSRMAESLLDSALQTGAFDEAVLVTDKQLNVPASVKVISSKAFAPFHFGKVLKHVLEGVRPGGFCYFSGGSAQLMGPKGILSFADAVKGSNGAIVANNAFSADFFGCADKSPFLVDDLPSADNSVPIYISDHYGVKLNPLPFSVEASFDVDTPTDALILSQAAGCPEIVRQAALMKIDGLPAGRLELAAGRLAHIKALMRKDFSDITLAGRVGPASIIELNRLTRCRYRLFSEERGMRSFGRDEEGTARTVFADLFKEKGASGMLELIMSQTEGFLFDDRVLFAAMRAKPKAEERYLSDLLAWELMPEGIPRQLAKAACEIDGICLGGHSLVNSGAVAIAK